MSRKIEKTKENKDIIDFFRKYEKSKGFLFALSNLSFRIELRV